MKKTIWHNKSYLYFWLAQSVSNLGSAITTLVLPLMILEMTESPFQVSVVSALQVAPYAILGLPAGVYLDKWDRKKVMLACDLLRFLAFGSITVVGWFGYVQIYQIYMVALISGICLVFHSIAEVSILPRLMEKEWLGKANGYTYAASNLMYLIGPSIGGVLYGAIGGSNTVGLDALSFFVSFVLLSLIKPIRATNEKERPETEKKVKTLIVEGFRYLWKQQTIRSMLIIVTFMNLVHAPYPLYTLVFAQGNLDATPKELGLLYGIVSLGGLVGSLVAGKWLTKFSFGKLMVVVIAVDAMFRFFVPFGTNMVLLLVYLMIIYGAMAVVNISIITLRQSIVEDKLLGRVNAAFRTVVFSVRPLGHLIGGIFLDKMGAYWSLIISALIYSLVLLLATLSKIYKTKERIKV